MMLAALALAAAGLAVQQNPAAPAAPAQAPPAPLPTIAARTAGLVRHDGFVPFVLDPKTGQLLLELPRDGIRLLDCVTLAAGLGSNPVGLDRGATGNCNVARFEPHGRKQVVIFENWNYRSSFTDNPAHARSVAEAFAPSAVAALPLAAEEGGRVLVDATDFLIHDWIDVTGALADAKQGAYVLSRDRSYIYEPDTRAFPRNTELEAALTFEARDRPGHIASAIAPDGRSLTLRQHVTLTELPDSGYRPRELDPRMNYFGITFKDYAQPVDQPLVRRWIARHRLTRVNPADPSSPIRNPIVYYVDRGIPEPLRTAALEGARFWTQAFDKAGLKGAFRVELLPDSVDPMDIRYNVVQWENRNEIGWSIGGGLIDPRTGEMIKGMARLDSHRGRTSYGIVAALAGAETAADTHFVLGRVRQVTAHEIGHTLGMAHNYIASTYGAATPGRGSVMDYPAPRVTLDEKGDIDVSDPYATGPGDYDVLSVRWGYGIFPPEHEADSLRAIVAEGLREGLLFLSDDDARPDYASDPRVSLWDDEATPEQFLARQMAVRRAAMRRFGLASIHPGEPVATLQERFARLYFFHRFAASSAAKTIGGVEYQNAVAGDGQQATRPVPGARQRAALAQLLAAVQPAELAIPDTILTLLGPRPFGYDTSSELLASRTRPEFDEFGAAATLAGLILDPILQRERLARLVQQSAHDPAALGLPELLAQVKRSVWDTRADRNPRDAGLRRAVQRVLVGRLLELAADTAAAPDVRATVELTLGTLHGEAAARGRATGGGTAASVLGRAHWQAIAAEIAAWQKDRRLPSAAPLPAPPGDPFGDGAQFP
ncbi:MAG TPA: zinc-dependent metalloprotease [Gemmatimonadales bacterium]|nr:zinc-dependent metalloprotease [Gemmatimonadales bacterium]